MFHHQRFADIFENSMPLCQCKKWMKKREDVRYLLCGETRDIVQYSPILCFFRSYRPLPKSERNTSRATWDQKSTHSSMGLSILDYNKSARRTTLSFKLFKWVDYMIPKVPTRSAFVRAWQYSTFCTFCVIKRNFMLFINGCQEFITKTCIHLQYPASMQTTMTCSGV